jgi:hypothetical protein
MMTYSPKHTDSLVASLQKDPDKEFTASQLKDRTAVPKKYVRRALTVDAEKEAKTGTAGVTVQKKGGLWRYS